MDYLALSLCEIEACREVKRRLDVLYGKLAPPQIQTQFLAFFF